LEVACRLKANGNSAARMPRPSSCTAIRSRPAASISTEIRPAPASSAFSSSSLSTAAGRSITSPAAICAATSSGS